MYKSIFLDIDGTILKQDHTIPDSTREAVEKLKKQNIHVAIATGRPINDTIPIAKELNIDSFISFNGAYANLEGKELFQKTIDKKSIDFIVSNAEFFSHDLLLSSKEKSFALNPNSSNFIAFTDNFNVQFSTFDSTNTAFDFLGGTIILEKEDEINLYDSPSNLNFVKGNTKRVHAFDITLPSVNKGTAVKEFIQLLGINREEVIAFGDGLNDKEMLSFVGTGVAMGNAQDALHKYANFTTTSVEEDGIWNGLKKLGLF